MVTAAPAAAGSSASGSGATSSAGAEQSSNDKKKSEETKKDEDDDNAWGAWSYTYYSACGLFSLSFLYHLYEGGGSLHQTEILMVESFRRLPFYWPLEASATEQRTQLDAKGLPGPLVDAFTEWFLAVDLENHEEGVTKDDILELFIELGFGNDDTAYFKGFLQTGDGRMEEERRMSGAGLQEAVTLMASLILTPERPKDPDAGWGKWLINKHLFDARVFKDEELVQATATLREKLAGLKVEIEWKEAARTQAQAASAATAQAAATVAASITGVGAALQPSQLAAVTPPSPRAAVPAPQADDGGLDEDQFQRIEEKRLARAEQTLLSQLARNGSLSVAEEARLNDVRRQQATLHS